MTTTKYQVGQTVKVVTDKGTVDGVIVPSVIYGEVYNVRVEFLYNNLNKCIYPFSKKTGKPYGRITDQDRKRFIKVIF